LLSFPIMKANTILSSLKPFRLVHGLVSLVILAMSVSSTSAYAWGHIDIFNNPNWAPSHIVFPAIQNKEIKYCLSVEPSQLKNFPMKSMKLQIESALKAWLVPVQQAGFIGDVKITRVKCALDTFDLKVAIGPELEYPNLAAFQIERKTEQGRNYSFVRIDTNFQDEGIKFIDSFKLLKLEEITDLKGMLAAFEVLRDEEALAFAEANGVDYDQLFWSTQRVLLHEIGHAYGLCDTIPTQRKNCDPDYLTEQDKGSVMSDSSYVTLTKDDEDGIISLFKRFLK